MLSVCKFRVMVFGGIENFLVYYHIWFLLSVFL